MVVGKYIRHAEARRRGGGRASRPRRDSRELRQKLREALAQKKLRMKEFVETCKADRRAVREQVREMRARSLRDFGIRSRPRAAPQSSRGSRAWRRSARSRVPPCDRARASAAVERQHQAELARLEREERSRRIEIRLAHERSLAAGALRSSLFGKLAPLFEREGARSSRLRASRAPRRSSASPSGIRKRPTRWSSRAVHKKVKETKRAIAVAERSVRATGGDVRAGGARRRATEERDRRARQERAAAQGSSPGEQRIGAAPELSLVPSPVAAAPAPLADLLPRRRPSPRCGRSRRSDRPLSARLERSNARRRLPTPRSPKQRSRRSSRSLRKHRSPRRRRNL